MSESEDWLVDRLKTVDCCIYNYNLNAWLFSYAAEKINILWIAIFRLRTTGTSNQNILLFVPSVKRGNLLPPFCRRTTWTAGAASKILGPCCDGRKTLLTR